MVEKQTQTTFDQKAEAEYEFLRAQLAQSIATLIDENQLSLDDIGKLLGFQYRRAQRRVQKVSQWIWYQDLKLSELVRLLAACDLQLYPILKPRRK